MSETPARPATLSAFWHDLPREGKLLLSVVAFEFLGTGLVLPFLVVYLHEIRGFALSDVGLLIGLGPLIGLLVVGPGGAIIDAYGARVVTIGTLCLPAYIAMLVLGCGAVVWVALILERRLPAGVNGTALTPASAMAAESVSAG